MDTHQNIPLPSNIAMNQSKVTLAIDLASILNRFEFPEGCPDTSDGLPLHEFLSLRAIPDQFCNRDHLESVLPAEVGEFRDAGHGAVRIHDFADDAACIQCC